MTDISPRYTTSTLTSTLGGDFLGNHLESLLIRQPSTRNQYTDKKSTDDAILTGFVSSKRDSRTSTTFSAVRDVQASPSSSSRGSNIEPALSPCDGIFGTGISSRAIGSHSSIQEGRIVSDGYHYFDKNVSHSLNTVASSGFIPNSGHRHNPSFTSISTKFGRRPSLRSTKERQQSNGSIPRSRTHTQNQVDVFSDTSSTQISSKYSGQLDSSIDVSIERRASDGTNATGITSPMARSESGWSQERDLPVKSAEEDNIELEETIDEGNDQMESAPTTPFSSIQWEGIDDQTTWERFKRGGVIEPPEAEPTAPISASWINGKVIYPSITTLSMKDKRTSFGSPDRSTIKADSSTAAKIVTLVPFGNDGRTFRFTSR